MRLSHLVTKLSMLLTVAATACTVSLAAETVDFSGVKPGQLPPHWVATQTGKGEARWAVEKDAEAPGESFVLKQSGVAAYPLCIKDDTHLKNGYVQVRFKALSGKEDQAGGVVWRLKDKDNYYVCRANALEGNVVLYKNFAGKRSSLDIVGRTGGYGVKEPVALGQWHTLRVDFKDSRFKVSFNGKQLFEVEDATFAMAGKVGVWTKADSVTVFDDFSYDKD